MELSIGIRHMGHDIQDKYLHVELSEEAPDSNEPRILCRRSFDCQDVEFVPRQAQYWIRVYSSQIKDEISQYR